MALPRWGSLDASSAWEEFAVACAEPRIVKRVAEFGPAFVLGVDWTSFQPYKHLQQALRNQTAPIPPYIFLNYRWGSLVPLFPDPMTRNAALLMP